MKLKLKKVGVPMCLQRLYRIDKVYILYLVAMVAVVVITGWYLRKTRLVETTRKDFEFIYRALDEDLESGVIERKGDGCLMPQLDPFDKEVMGLEKSLPTVTCAGNDWVECYMDKCFVIKSIRKEIRNLSCVYRDIVYVEQFNHHVGPPTRLSADQKYKLTRSDHVKVSCLGTSRLIPDPLLYWSGHKAGLRHVPLRKRSSGRARLSVLMLCLDSMSKNGFIRKMPRSYAALTKMGAFILNGYNIVGGGALAALFPIITGNLTESKRSFIKDVLDDSRCIFRRLSRRGYRTAYFGKSEPLGSFHGSINGSHHPMDHYLPPLFQEVYGNHSGQNTRSPCIGDTSLHELLLNLTHQFLKLNGNHFSFTFITDIGLDNYSLGTAVDEDLAFFLHRIQRGGKLKKTVLFVMGDHGPRVSPIRETLQGKYEELLPLMAIVVPDVLKQTRPDAVAAMKANANVLTTPFDIHSTLIDILDIGDQRNRFKVPGADMERALTLLKPIPSTRSCGEAGVLPHWCVCAAWDALSPTDPMYKEIGDLVVDYINSLTITLRLLCTARELLSVDYVLRLSPSPNKKILKNKVVDDGYLGKVGGWVLPRSNYYQAKVTMDPGRAVFEATLRYFGKGDYFAITDEDISRVNPYNNESACLKMNHRHLHKFCYCT